MARANLVRLNKVAGRFLKLIEQNPKHKDDRFPLGIESAKLVREENDEKIKFFRNKATKSFREDFKTRMHQHIHKINEAMEEHDLHTAFKVLTIFQKHKHNKSLQATLHTKGEIADDPEQVSKVYEDNFGKLLGGKHTTFEEVVNVIQSNIYSQASQCNFPLKALPTLSNTVTFF